MSQVGPVVRDPFDHSGLTRGADGTLRHHGAPGTYGEALHAAVAAHPAALAVLDTAGTALSYARLWDEAARIAGGLADAGLRRGDRVAIDLGNSIEWVLSFLGVVLAGGVAVPLDQRGGAGWRDAVVADCEPRFTIGPDSPAPLGARRVVDADPEDLAQLLYTSGTTGDPKGVMIRQRNLAALGEITRRVLTVSRPDDQELRNLVAIPLCHAAGCNAQLLPTLALGGTAILAGSSNAADVMAAALEFRPNTMLAVPAVYHLIVQRESEALRAASSLRRLVYGAAPVSRSLVEQLRGLRPDIELGNAFGMTEISNMALYLPDAFTLSHYDSIGFPIPGIEVELRSRAADGQGELYLRGPNMALGYWRRPELSEQVFGSGWVRSGDIAVVDDAGLVYLRDRAQDVINRGGEKIYTLEVENVLLNHPGIAEAAVLAVPDVVMGEKVGAVVVTTAGARISAEDVAEHATRLLPRFAVPEYVVLRAQPLPRSGSGKVLKADLRRECGWEA